MTDDLQRSTDSPCVGECVLDPDGYCKGCRRSIPEIAGWQGMAESQRRRILAELPQRRLRAEKE